MPVPAEFSDKLIVTPPKVYQTVGQCGYCEDEQAAQCTIGFHCENMTAAHYEELINGNWRRSGQFVYKPDNLRNCCVYYTLRTSIQLLPVTKEHKKCLKNVCKRIGIEGVPQPFDLRQCVGAISRSTQLRIRFESCDFSERKFQLYKGYQMAVHHDDEAKLSRRSFTRFLCAHPFSDPTTLRHLCYYIGDQLVGVSVLDVLPSGLSSVYFFYDYGFRDWELGKFSALYEICLTELMGLRYYYLGYYIHNCGKMAYKKKFGGEVLNLLDRRYYPLSEVLPMMGPHLVCYEDGRDAFERYYGAAAGAAPAAAAQLQLVDAVNRRFGTTLTPDGYHVIPGVNSLREILQLQCEVFLFGYDDDNEYENGHDEHDTRAADGGTDSRNDVMFSIFRFLGGSFSQVLVV